MFGTPGGNGWDHQRGGICRQPLRDEIYLAGIAATPTTRIR